MKFLFSEPLKRGVGGWHCVPTSALMLDWLYHTMDSELPCLVVTFNKAVVEPSPVLLYYIYYKGSTITMPCALMWNVFTHIFCWVGKAIRNIVFYIYKVGNENKCSWHTQVKCRYINIKSVLFEQMHSEEKRREEEN